jgi:predicted DCC family thiol-disulfide oxidoreductase YuxK
MKFLHVLYDRDCALCVRCAHWLSQQPAFIELRFLPLQSAEIDTRFPGLKEWRGLDLREKLVVISDAGLVYQGSNAWIMCLYALREYREWSQRLAHPALQPFARRVCETISRNRLLISRFLQTPVDEMSIRLAGLFPQSCSSEGGC